MKKQLLGLFLSFSVLTTYAQTSTGLVAHWDFNGTVNDVSGNGHNGTAHNLTPAAGVDGVANTAYSFNGSNSFISIPTSTAFDVTKYTICAKIKVANFNTGSCQGNTIITRGGFVTTGSWALGFDDNAYNDCTVLDTTKELFDGKAGTNFPSAPAAWQYTAPIAENKWYKVVMTYDSMVWKIYINDTLKNTVTGPGNPIGICTDSVTIGMDVFDALTGHPYQFSGTMDDIRFYNTVLADSDITLYDAPTAVPDLVTNDNIKVYPNPASNKISVQLPDSVVKYDMQIINQLGQICMTTEIIGGAADIDVAALPGGIYIMKLTCNGSSFYKKIQKN